MENLIDEIHFYDFFKKKKGGRLISLDEECSFTTWTHSSDQHLPQLLVSLHRACVHTECGRRSCSRNCFSLGLRNSLLNIFPSSASSVWKPGEQAVPVQTGRGAIRQSFFIPLDFFIQLTDFSSEIKSFSVLAQPQVDNLNYM